MLEALIFVGLGILALTTTNDNKKITKDSNTYNRNEKLHNLKNKYGNMTTDELDYHLRSDGYNEFLGSYSREYKIDKIINKKMNV